MLDVILKKIDEGTVTADDFNALIDEANAKSTIERVHRRTRVAPGVGSHEHSMVGRVVPKHEGNNDPRQHRGKRNFRPKRQAALNQKQKERVAKECLDYLTSNHGKTIVEDISTISPDARGTIRATISKMLLDSKYRASVQKHCLGESEFDDQWLYGLLVAIDQGGTEAVLSE